jgi:hypothetical protein
MERPKLGQFGRYFDPTISGSQPLTDDALFPLDGTLFDGFCQL